ncbi:hypothetical protein FHS59_000272 [Algoriphagus iocasae]|uniref:IPT/TIG domain-containing protein n=1 Tax=Algoriphagus iocasae TaxID=1836499 RepID=A0A841MGP3_9BACT|nr:hypothetical protein [Algoriphagus iocasae]MBB6324657.1 hypothetical protein [Algoriphagus iocasae]
MRRQLLAFFLLIGLISSCNKEEVIPRTNPRFSVTMVQDISEGGAEFRAQMIDYGSDEILEYGFVYSEGENPKIGYGDFVSEQGRPNEFFTLKAITGLIKGKTYFVAAYLKTNAGIIYSEPSSFLAQGSEGFVLNRIELKQPVYFGDTILVFGEKLSSNPAYYDVTVNGIPALVSNLSNTGFKIKIPSWFETERVDDEHVVLTINLKVVGKTLDLRESVRFKEPEFIPQPVQEVFYKEKVVVKGNYLLSDEVKVIMKNDTGGGWELPLVSFEENEVGFLAEINNYIYKNGSLFLRIRGKDYPMEDVFKMKGSELEPGQLIRGSSREYFVVKGSNFIEQYQSNEFSTNIPGINAYSEYSSENEVVMYFNGEIVTRELKLFANNFGQKSQNFAEIHFTDPYLNYLKMPSEFRDYRFIQESGVTVGDIGYFFLERNVYRIDPKTRGVSIVAKAPESVFHLAGGFSYAAINGKIYLGAVSSSESQGSFWEFDPKTNGLRRLADIPSKAKKPKLVYATQTHLYYEGGYTQGAGGYTWDPGVFKYSFASNSWEKLNREFDNDDYLILFRTFRYNGSIYTIRDETQSIYPVIRKFNESTEDWEFVRDLGYYERVTTANELFVIGDWVYSFNHQSWAAFNMKTFENKIWERSYESSSFAMNYSFQANGKIYAYDGNNYLVEIDPAYFSD